jgi:hypothetical protein
MKSLERCIVARCEQAPPNKRLLLAGRKRLSRRGLSLAYLVCGGFGTPRSRSAGRYAASQGIPLTPRQPPPPPVLPWSWHKTPGWRGQYERLRRWHQRLKEATNPLDREDFLYAFFQASNNLRDWLVKLGDTPQSSIEDLYRDSEYLRLGQDVANAIKHGSLSDPKLGQEFSMAREYADPGLGTFTPDSHLRILTPSGKTLDAFDVAARCAGAWEDFLRPYA